MLKFLNRLNEKGASAMGILAITISIIVLVTGLIAVYYQFFYKPAEFSEEEIAKAKEVAQNELGQALQLSETYKFEDRFDAIQSIGFGEPERDDTDYVFEKKDSDSNYYILLRLKPHDTYENVSRVLVSIFDKENGTLITEEANVINWKK